MVGNETPRPGWQGGSTPIATTGFRNAINNDQATLISGWAHGTENLLMDVNKEDWESLYHNTKPFFVYSTDCHSGDFVDPYQNDGVLDSMLFHSDTELAFAMYSEYRLWLGKFFIQQLFQYDIDEIFLELFV